MARYVEVIVDVEFMDGEERSYRCGGSLSGYDAMQTIEGQLVLSLQTGEHADRRHVASLPLVNIREWKMTAK